MRYSPEIIRSEVTARFDALFAPWTLGRPENWVPDPATKDLIALGYWLDEELRRLSVSNADRRTQCFKYNRLSRTYDIWETAAECLNDVLDDKVEQDRRGHRRWG